MTKLSRSRRIISIRFIFYILPFLTMMIMVTTPSISIIEKGGITIKNNYYAYASSPLASSPYNSSSSLLSQQTSATTTLTEDFNFAAVGDWDCTPDTINTVKNIMKHDPEIVLALGDLSYSKSAQCWLDIINPVADKTKIVIGNHETDSTKNLKTIWNFLD